MTDKREIAAFRDFRKSLYRGDGFYFGTAEFVTDMLLNRTTAFARSCETRLLSVERSGERKAQCMLVKAPHTDFAQLSFFDCADDDTAAAELIEKSKRLAREWGASRLIAGLNGHLSYGVGLLTECSLPNTFDTSYNKPHYARYFENFGEAHGLTAYRCSLAKARKALAEIKGGTNGYGVREADFSRFRCECEIMRRLCDETIGETYLYTPTDEGHFYELMKDLKILLSRKNLLFLTYFGEDVGFLFWHPDFNEAVKAGESVNAPKFALSYLFNRNKIRTVKFNAFGVKREHRGKGTLALIRGMNERLCDGYDFIETNFVWDSNRASSLVTRKLIGDECRKFKVYEEKL